MPKMDTQDIIEANVLAVSMCIFIPLGVLLIYGLSGVILAVGATHPQLLLTAGIILAICMTCGPCAK